VNGDGHGGGDGGDGGDGGKAAARRGGGDDDDDDDDDDDEDDDALGGNGGDSGDGDAGGGDGGGGGGGDGGGEAEEWSDWDDEDDWDDDGEEGLEGGGKSATRCVDMVVIEVRSFVAGLQTGRLTVANGIIPGEWVGGEDRVRSLVALGVDGEDLDVLRWAVTRTTEDGAPLLGAPPNKQ
jgi:hypothetical protein